MSAAQNHAQPRHYGEVTGELDGVRMSARTEMRIRHASDTVTERGTAFGGDSLGHWNVDRVNRLLDAFDAPVRHLSIPPESMVAMARVGAPDMTRVGLYAQKGIGSMPPLTFVTLPIDGGEATMLVDGHHRLMALAMTGGGAVPARVLPASLTDDVRIVEMSEIAVFPAFAPPSNRVEYGDDDGR